MNMNKKTIKAMPIPKTQPRAVTTVPQLQPHSIMLRMILDLRDLLNVEATWAFAQPQPLDAALHDIASNIAATIVWNDTIDAHSEVLAAVYSALRDARELGSYDTVAVTLHTIESFCRSTATTMKDDTERFVWSVVAYLHHHLDPNTDLTATDDWIATELQRPLDKVTEALTEAARRGYITRVTGDGEMHSHPRLWSLH